MATPITVGERIVLHLAQYTKNQNDFDAPFEVSQDGIGEALRISRAHAAIELKKLKESGTVAERISHIRAGAVKRKVYFLTQTGEDKARNLKDFANRQGIEIMPLLDLKKCKGEELWNGLNPELRSLLAKAVVFRKPFKRSALPSSNVSLLPEDREGMVDIPPSLRSSIPVLMERPALREAHSFAADYWLQEGDYVERLYHLLQANRSMEAQMLLANRGWQMARSSGPEMLEALKGLDQVMPRYAREVRRIKGESARRNGDTPYGLQVAEDMLLTGEQEEIDDGLALKGRLLLAGRQVQEALDHLKQAQEGHPSPLLDCDIAMCLGQLGQKEEAIKLLESIGRKGGIADPDLLEEVYARKGQVLSLLGRQEESIANYSKALGLARPGDKRDIYKAMAACYDALDMKEKAREYSRKASSKK
ncbi:MAG: tetratricopeptide repeat protein [Methanomassiliicoccales archaeon]|nr:tetratricopeptide repeat protein [Methanomassiliicoccales archaeon]